MDMKERRALAQERMAARHKTLEAEAKAKGVRDVEGYIRATLELENGIEIDDIPDEPRLH